MLAALAARSARSAAARIAASAAASTSAACAAAVAAAATASRRGAASSSSSSLFLRPDAFAKASPAATLFSSRGLASRPVDPSSPQALARLAASRPASLALPPPTLPSDAPPDPETSPPGPLRRALLTLGGFYSAESRAIRAAQAWHAAVVAAAAGPGAPLARSAGLDPARFADTHALLGLHLWLALVRLRVEGAPGKAISQALYENFSDDVEARVRAAGVRVRVGKWLSELERMFYGAATAYDRAIGAIPGEGSEGSAAAAGGASPSPPQPLPGGSANAQAALTAALLRNAYGGDASRSGDAGALARYALRELACLALTDSEAVMTGRVRFSGGGGEGAAQEQGGGEEVAAAPKAAA